jgi:4-hydroxybutyrate dehydrogenase/sulfolactaldehyde 3-reductase
MVKLAQKDQRLAIAMAKSLGSRTPVGQAAHDTLAEAAASGLAELDVSAVMKLREEQAGVLVRKPQAGA